MICQLASSQEDFGATFCMHMHAKSPHNFSTEFYIILCEENIYGICINTCTSVVSSLYCLRANLKHGCKGDYDKIYVVLITFLCHVLSSVITRKKDITHLDCIL